VVFLNQFTFCPSATIIWPQSVWRIRTPESQCKSA